MRTHTCFLPPTVLKSVSIVTPRALRSPQVAGCMGCGWELSGTQSLDQLNAICAALYQLLPPDPGVGVTCCHVCHVLASVPVTSSASLSLLSHGGGCLIMCPQQLHAGTFNCMSVPVSSDILWGTWGPVVMVSWSVMMLGGWGLSCHTPHNFMMSFMILL